jgi:hypothetical protein
MAYAAISYDIKPGFDAEIAEIFSPANFKRASSPIIRNAKGRVVGHIIGTGLFLSGDAMARVIQYDGELDDVARHMAAQAGVHEAERAILPYLRTPRHTETEAEFIAHFQRSTMTCLVSRVYDDQPLTGIVAVADRVPPQAGPELREILAEAWPEVTGPGGGQVHAALAFLVGDRLIRALVYRGDLDDVLGGLADEGALETERALALAFGRADGLPGDESSFPEIFRAKSMTCLSCLSIGMLTRRAEGAPA